MDPAVVAHFRRLRDILGEQIEQLPERQRLVITLYYFEGMNLKEIGKVLEVTESRVSQIHHQALRSLKARVRRHLSRFTGNRS